MLNKKNRYAALLGTSLLCLQLSMHAKAQTPDNLNGYASAIMGNGTVYGTNTSGHPGMRWRAGEIRLGHTIDLFGPATQDHALRLDAVYYNEGHPDNNHRDGYALQMMYRTKLYPEFDLELGAGPYLSANRTNINGVEYDDSRVGVLVSMALLMRLDAWSPGLHMRIGYNHAAVPGGPSSDAVMVGIGKDLGVPASMRSAAPRHAVWLGGAAGIAQTNHAEPQKKFTYALEAKTYSGLWAASMSAIDEGKDVRVDRHGIAVQGWYVQPVSNNWTLSAGAGPYLAWNTQEANNPRVDALLSVQLDRKLGDNWRVYTNFGRVITFQNKNDADLITFGLMRRFDL